ncbi:ribonuclease 4-like [Myotis daubentonii]|uniref:ribonuclease 4-like n=1 Tax=Myotis daubentonii TaxID=98922 RepID=UPI002873EA55|nr:ribonuclease 4-like [Myotis daubentonii]XP_059562253.1 ribonuclease 4-like [Myotis daubentonii]XP_059562262.1 ribonuclease 4-like [Myotis daubentonii]
MALQKTLSLLLLSLLTLLGLGLVQPSYGQATNKKFKWQHVDSTETGGNNFYCDTMMQSRGMTRPTCKQLNTFIHENIETINNICNAPNIRCKNGRMNCHVGEVRVTGCKDTGSSPPPKCSYQATAGKKNVTIACDGNPLLPVHFDGYILP